VQGNAATGGNSVLECDETIDSAKLVQNYTTPPISIIEQLNTVNYSYTKRSLECDCTSGFPSCPASAGGDINFRKIYQLRSFDNLYDLSGRNVTDWLIKTEFNKTFFRKRFGGFEFIAPLSNNYNNLTNRLFKSVNELTGNLGKIFKDFTKAVNLAFDSMASDNTGLEKPTNAEFEQPLDQLTGDTGSTLLIADEKIKVWYNLKGYISNVAYLNAINNAILRSHLGRLNRSNSTTNNPLVDRFDPMEHGIVANNHPMNFTRQQFFTQLEQRVFIDLFVAVCIIFALSFIPASFLVFLLEERENNSKQLQFVSGIRPYIYWISNFVWDLLNYIVPCFLCIMIFIIFGVKAYMSSENFPFLICLMLLYGWACIPLMYPLNYIFQVPSTAFVMSSCLNVFIGVVSTMTTTVLTQLGDEEPDLLKVNEILKPVFLILFPHYCLGQGFLEMATLYNVAEVQRNFGRNVTYSPFKFESGGRNLLAMFFQGIVFFILNLLIQYKFFVRFRPTYNLDKLNLPPSDHTDEDVLREKKRIAANEAETKANYKNKFKMIRSKLKEKIHKSVTDKSETKLEKDNAEEDYIKLINLTKIYKKLEKFKLKRHVAVNNLSIGINKGECFGLIGVNGAGNQSYLCFFTYVYIILIILIFFYHT
jgi:ATP-binding cassette, subfamily A (ABC1), member 1